MEKNVKRNGGLEWIDVIDPNPAELNALAAETHLPPTVVQDCLDPAHLPKYESFDQAHFVILRIFDPTARPGTSTVRGLTRKVAIFWREGLLLTVHRVRLPFIERLQEIPEVFKNPVELFLQLLKEGILTFEEPLRQIDGELEKAEQQIRPEGSPEGMIRKLYGLRNRLATFRRLFWHTSVALKKCDVPRLDRQAAYQDVLETMDALLFYSDQLFDETTGLTGLELSMAAHRTNQVIRVLTLFSVFFMPLTFIVGIYGMNFERMPEFQWEHGHWYVWGLMGAVTLAIGMWFRRKRWM